MEHPTIAQVNDYIDGALAPAERDAFARHAAACDSCQRELAAYVRLQSRLQALPADFVPPADLWHAVVVSTRRARYVTQLARAAAILLLVGGTALAAYLVRSRGADFPTSTARTVAFTPDPAEAQLMNAYTIGRDFLPPPSAAAVERTVASLDAAIRELGTAVREYPDDRRLATRLARARQLRLRIMADAVAWSQSTRTGGAT